MQNYQNYQVDLSNCNSEPIHLIGRIQAHGFLLIINQTTLVIEQISRNVADFISFSPEELLGKTLSELEASITLETLLQVPSQGPQLLTLGGKSFVGFCHLSGEKLILECEPNTPYTDQDKIKHNNLLIQLHHRLNALYDLKSAAKVVADVLLDILQYDRVNITRFDSDWNTDVIAESKTDKLSSFMGHHFPDTDIPAPARELLRQKHVRQIPNVDAPASEVIPYHNPTTGAPTNILQSELRNPSEIHLEYIKNTGVAATISFSIIVKDKLWGVIACHHVEPTFIDIWRRQLCDLMVKTFGSVIASLQEKRNYEQFNLYKQLEQSLVNNLNNHYDIEELFNNQPNLLDITESTGAALLLDNTLTKSRFTPSEEQIRRLTLWLSNNVSDSIYHTNSLSRDWPEAEEYQNVASGLLALEISRYNQEYLLFFKPEIKETRVWAGNPEKPVQREGLHIHPRKSFEKWTEVVKGKSLPWTLNELEITQILLKDLIAIRLRNQTNQLSNLNHDLYVHADLLKTKNSQLEDFAYIISHNLRSPLANIKGLHQIYTEEPSPKNAQFVIEHIKQMSDNMSQTIQDLNVILKTHLVEELPKEEVSLIGLIEKEKQNLEAIILQSDAEIRTELQVPTIKMPKLYIESILHNFISNSLKYRSPERKPIVLIKSWEEQDQLHLSISDNGLGMDLEKMGDKLFGLYRTFHRNAQAKGLGLYLTKMQVKALGGTINVISEPDKGTTFTIVFGAGAYLPTAD